MRLKINEECVWANGKHRNDSTDHVSLGGDQCCKLDVDKFCICYRWIVIGCCYVVDF